MNRLRLPLRGVRLRSWAALLTVGAGLVLTGPAEAAQVRLGLGANYWFERGALFDFNLSATGRVSRHLQVGGRFGAFLATEPNTLGVPIDLLIRGSFDNFYLEFLAGPWVRFEDDPLLGHAAFGFGLQSRDLSLGLEIGYLNPEPIAGLKVGFRL